jgi:hypothetical protein
MTCPSDDVFNNLQQWVQERKEEDCLCSTLFLCSKTEDFLLRSFSFPFRFFFVVFLLTAWACTTLFGMLATGPRRAGE